MNLRGVVFGLFVVFSVLITLALPHSSQACYRDDNWMCPNGIVELREGLGCPAEVNGYRGEPLCDAGVTPPQVYSAGCTVYYQICNSPPPPSAPPPPPPSCGAMSSGSIVNVDNQVLQEKVPIVGTPFSLVYSSDKVPGNTSWYRNHIYLTGLSVASTVTQVGLSVQIGTHRTITYIDTTLGNYDAYDLYWDGNDSSSNPVAGSVEATSSVTETNSPANPSETPVVGKFFLGFTYINGVGLGGWDINIHHSYDPVRKILFTGGGSQVSAEFTTDNSGNHFVPAQDGSEVYVFDSGWKHITTKNGLTGTTKYTFGYTSGKLSSITDGYSNLTTIHYSSGVADSIEGPYGQITDLAVNGNGYISAIENPNGETHNMTYYTGGLLHTFERPNSVTSTMTYDTAGRLLTDTSDAGNSITLSKTNTTDGWDLTETTAFSS